jgi:sialic acid synthase
MTFRIAGRAIGRQYRTFVIAEIGLNHNGDMAIAKQLIDAAKVADADAVKLQKRDSRALLTRAQYDSPYTGPNSFGATYGLHREALEFGMDQYQELKAYAEERKLVFLASPWDQPSVDFLVSLGVVAMKIASADVTNTPLLRRVSACGIPTILSTGMASEDEISIAHSIFESPKTPVALLHCVSTYPASFEELHLQTIGYLLEKFGDPVGYSGHERGIAISAAAVALGASIIERHITLDRSMKGPDHAASLEPTGFSKMVRDIRAVEASLSGVKREVLESERPVRAKLGKSVVAKEDMPIGTVVEARHLTTKSPGTGLNPQLIDSIIGRQMRVALAVDQQVTLDMLE